MNTVLTGLAALLLASSAQAQETTPICSVPPPKVPKLEWRGQAAYSAMAQVKDGRVVAVTIVSLQGGIERRTQRALVTAIEAALRRASCQPGEHVFQQRFDFEARASVEEPAPAPSTPS
ncbi:MAG: hypothetical protein ACT6S0_16250 [Roseateles sp.]|uniref:hypothetical protein n=1 Tax=Roseateles sp. TaxID=1971397 RepID=UPI0040373E2E